VKDFSVFFLNAISPLLVLMGWLYIIFAPKVNPTWFTLRTGGANGIHLFSEVAIMAALTIIMWGQSKNLKDWKNGLIQSLIWMIPMIALGEFWNDLVYNWVYFGHILNYTLNFNHIEITAFAVAVFFVANPSAWKRNIAKIVLLSAAAIGFNLLWGFSGVPLTIASVMLNYLQFYSNILEIGYWSFIMGVGTIIHIAYRQSERTK